MTDKLSERDTPACAHLHVRWRTELVDESKPGGEIRGWWECDSGCGKVFVGDHEVVALEAELEETQYGLAMTQHYWINPMEYEEDRVKWSKRVEMTERALYNAVNEGVAHAFLNLDADSRRARVMTQEEVAAEKAGEEA